MGLDLDLAIHCMRCGADVHRLSAAGETAVQLVVGTPPPPTPKPFSPHRCVLCVCGFSLMTASAHSAPASAPSSSTTSRLHSSTARSQSVASGAAHERRLSLLSYLLDAGAARSLANREMRCGFTALHATAPPPPPSPLPPAAAAASAAALPLSAATRQALALCDVLLQFGADPTAQDFSGESVLQRWKKHPHGVCTSAPHTRSHHNCSALELTTCLLVCRLQSYFEALVAHHRALRSASSSSSSTATASSSSAPLPAARVRQCWCASGRAHALCHAPPTAATPHLLPIVPDWLDCPCGNPPTTSSATTTAAAQLTTQKPPKSYAQCCKRRGVVYRESDTEFVREVKVANAQALHTLQALSAGGAESGGSSSGAAVAAGNDKAYDL
jgi:hypothetical protein